ncbi:hypothetical protein [Dokdonia sp.]|uniref:hypothetical protein n=1 Tax=Dokdonia sp. TaxID=2024995 RepID=UPI0032631B85
MKIKSIKKLIGLFLIFNFIVCCKTDKIEGVIIGDTLLAHQSFAENQKMQHLISNALQKDKKSIIELKDFPNGGAASAYDLGYVLTQIIYRIGEDEFAEIMREIPKAKRKGLEGLIMVGLEYGDNDYDGKVDNKRMGIEFPQLIEVFKE